jgi:hypothetical protein
MPRQIRISPDVPCRPARRNPHDWLIWVGGLVASVLILNGAEPTAGVARVSFSKEVAPILQHKCVTCHGPEKTKGGYQLHAFAVLMKAGESKEAPIVPGEPARSHLLSLLTAKDSDDRMPQKDDPLAGAQIALIERWIQEGARFDGPDPNAALVSLLPELNHPDPPVSYPRPVPILALAFSPDGKELAVSGYHEVTLWNPAEGLVRRRIRNVAAQSQALSFSPDGSVLAVCGGNPGRFGEVKLIDPQSGSILKTLGTAGDLLLALAFTSDGKRLAVGGADNSIRVFNIASGREELRIEQHADWVMSLAFSPDGAQFASASRDKTARLFNARTGEVEETYAGHGEPVFGVAFSGDGQRVFSGGRDKEFHAWQIKDAKKLFETGGFGGDVFRLVAQDDQLFTCGADHQVRQHQISEKKAELVRTYSGHNDVVYAVAVHQLTKRLASGSFDGEVFVWNTETGERLANFVAAPGNRVKRPVGQSRAR